MDVANYSYPHHLFVELNMSNDTCYLDNILSYLLNLHPLIGCHNFYLQRYKGLSCDYFVACSRRYKKHRFRTTAFVSSQPANIGSWTIYNGFCILEHHRDLPIIIQTKELWATGLIDDVIIGDTYDSEEELCVLSEIDPSILSLDIEVKLDISLAEKSILFDTIHMRRGDISNYMVRSTEIRNQKSTLLIKYSKT